MDFFLKSPRSLMRGENEKDTMAARQCTVSVSIFFPLANEVTFIQSQIISFPFSLLAEREKKGR